MDITKFNEKFNRLEGNVYTFEEIIRPINGVYEAELIHDNVETSTINIYTGSKLTGDKINTYTISTPSLTPWRTHIKIFSNISPLYISYEFTGDTVEAEDINNVQDAINDTQKELNKEVDRATNAEKVITDNLNKEIDRATNRENIIENNLNNEIVRSTGAEKTLQNNINNEADRAKSAESTLTTNLNNEVTRATNKEAELSENISSEVIRATNKESALQNSINNEATRAKSAEKTLTDNLSKEVSRASSAESILTTNLDKEISRAKAKESSIDTELDNRYTKDKVFTKDEVLKKIKELIGTAPEVLDTFGEIAEALGNDPNFATTITTMLAGKVDKVTGKQLSTNDFDNTQKSNLTDCNNKKHTHSNKSVLDGITSALIAAWNNAVTHISDTVKHITSAERTLWNTVSNKLDKSGGKISNPNYRGQLEINRDKDGEYYYAEITFSNKTKLIGSLGFSGKEEAVVSNADGSSHYKIYHEGNKPTKTDVGLGNVDNTSDLNKPISTATQNALNGKANSSHTHTKSQITDMPTKLSQFTNDKGFITQNDVDTSQNHTHSNKAVLDKITETNIKTMNDITSGIGGRNLLINCGQYTKNSPMIIQSNKKDGHDETHNIYTAIDLSRGTYILQAKTDGKWIDSHDTSGKNPADKLVALWLYRKAGTTSTGHMFIQMVNNSSKINIETNGTYYLRTNLYSDGTTNVQVKLWDIKLEKGSVSTDWTPAPEDMLKKGMTWNELEGI